VTCFVVDKRHRRKGVAGVALRAALDAIRRRGGGTVEACPVAAWTHGPAGSSNPLSVQGVGPVAPAHGSFGNVSTSGTVSMFEKEGFQAVAVVGARPSARVLAMGATGCRVLMRKVI
jgi:GNAT superfamily N-acetyltransferase